MQQAAVELSAEGLVWLSDRLEAALVAHGKVPADDLEKLDWPDMTFTLNTSTSRCSIAKELN